MQIEWLTDTIYQAHTYIRMARRIQMGFYQRTRMMVLPRRDSDAWFFPDYGLLDDEEYCTHLESIKEMKALVIENELLVQKTLQKFDLPIKEEDFKNHKAEFEKYFPHCDTFLQNLFLHYSQVKKLAIIPTYFGSGSSYYTSKDNENNYTIWVTIRSDKPTRFIIMSLISELIQLEQEYDNQKIDEWNARKHVSDFISNNTKLKELLPPSNEQSGIHNFMDEYKGELAEESAHYLAKLGYPLPNSFSYKKDTICFNGKPVHGLENKEIDILKFLIDRRPEIVNFAEIGDVYWGEDAADKFSLYSIAKLIEKIRKSFEENHIPQRCLQTVRKRGYLLYD